MSYDQRYVGGRHSQKLTYGSYGSDSERNQNYAFNPANDAYSDRPPSQSCYQQPPEPMVEEIALMQQKTIYIAFSSTEIRAAFVRKVFGLLSFMLAIVLSMVVLFCFQWVSFILCFVLYFFIIIFALHCRTDCKSVVFFIVYLAIICCKNVRRRFPGNIICLMLLTLSMGYMTAMITAYYDTIIVMLAISITTICCLSIILFAAQSKYDFTSWMGAMFVVVMALMVFGIIALIGTLAFKLEILYIIYSGIAALVFVVFLAIDTQLIMGGKRFELSPEEYILGAVMLFVDIVEIFLYLLTILGYANQK